MYISDSEGDEQPPSPDPDLGISRHTCRGEALEDVDYNTMRHPQDKDLPVVRRRRRVRRPEDNDTGARTSPVKIRRIIESGAVGGTH